MREAVDKACRRMIAMNVPKESWKGNHLLRRILILVWLGISKLYCGMFLATSWLTLAQEFILLVILVSFLELPVDHPRDLDLVEFFAGVARISKLSTWMGYNCRAFDVTYAPLRHPQKLKRGKFRRPSMDLNGAAGLANSELN